jgi:hypothetical protein
LRTHIKSTTRHETEKIEVPKPDRLKAVLAAQPEDKWPTVDVFIPTYDGKAVGEHHDPLQMTIPLARQEGAGPQLGSGSVEVGHQPVNPFRRSGPKPFEHTPTVCI